MKLREYETIFIIRPDAGEEESTQVLDRVKGVIDSKQGTMLREQYWGKKKLAYEVKKHLKGHFHYFQYAGPNDLVDEFERHLKLIEAVIKFQTVKLADNIDLDARKSEIQKEEDERAAQAAERTESRKPEESASNDDDDDSDDDKEKKPAKETPEAETPAEDAPAEEKPAEEPAAEENEEKDKEND